MEKHCSNKLGHIQAMGNDGLDQGNSNRACGKWFDFCHVLETGVTEYPDVLDVGYEIKQVKMFSRVLAWATQKGKAAEKRVW